MTKQTELKELGKSLAKLTEPYSLNDLNSLFDDYRHLLVEPCSEQDPLYSEWKPLNTIYQQCLNWQSLNLQSMNFQKQERQLKAAKNQAKQTSALLLSLQDQYEQLKKDLEHQFIPLLDELNAARLKQQSCLVALTNPGLEIQLYNLVEYRALIETQINTISLDVARLSLYTNDKQRKEIAGLLRQLTIIVPSSCGLEELPRLKIQVSEQLQNTQKTEQSLRECHNQFEQYSSRKKTILEIEALRSEKQKLDENLKKTAEQISSFKLDPSIALQMTAQFNETPDKKTLLKKLQSELAQRNSYLNPQAWREWATTQKEFKLQTEAKTLELQLTQLLATNDDLNKALLGLDQQLAKSESILNLDNPLTSQTQSRIPADIADLLSLSSDQITTINDLTLFNKLIAQLQAVNSQSTRLKKALELLDTLTDIENASFAIHKQIFSKLKIDCSTPTNDSEAVILKKSLDEQPSKLEELKVKLSSCKECETSIATLQSLAQRIDQTRIELNPPNTKGQKKRLVEETDRVRQITELQTTITHNITEFKRTYVPEKELKSEAENQFPKLWNQLNQWNDKIKPFSQDMTGELNAWYERLFQVLQNNATEEKTLLQSIQLLRDIHCELKYTDKGVVSAVLKNYYLHNPNPSTSYMKLLELKPALTVEPEDLPALTDKKMQKRMKRLYDHQQSLAQHHPKEAALLQQAAINFHQIALECQNKKRIPKSVSPTFYSQDPRYQSLEKHRGIGKAWEWLAELCTTLLNKMRGTPRADYRNRFFFAPTQSSQLLKDAATALGANANAINS